MSDERGVLVHLGTLATQLGPMVAPAGFEELLQAITATAREMFDAGACALALLDDDAEELVFHVADGQGDIVGTRIAVCQDVAGWVAGTGQAIAIDDLSEDPRFARDLAERSGYVPRSILAMPLETARETLGVIQILDPKIEDTCASTALLELFAHQVSLALESQRVFDDLGRMLFAAAAKATEPGDVATVLEEMAAQAPPTQAGFAELAAHMSELVRLGDDERAAATRLIGDLLGYIRGRHA